MSAQSQQELSRFIGRSVSPNTSRVYEKNWEQWISFLKSEVNEDDPFVGSAVEEEKAPLVGIMMLRRHEQGLRGKRATAFAASIRMHFVQQGISTNFINSPVIATARAACEPKPEELRERKDSCAATSVCESILVGMKARMWTGRGWTGADMRDRMTDLGCMWAFEMGPECRSTLPLSLEESTTAFAWMILPPGPGPFAAVSSPVSVQRVV